MRPPPLPHQIVVLQRVLKRAAEAAGAGAPPLVVFDLDGTLFDNRPRTAQILSEYAEEVREEFPEVADALGEVPPDAVQYLLSDTLRRCDITRVDVVADATHYWRERFFTEPYLKYDGVTDGAVEYARACLEAGASVLYLAGRDVADLLHGTVASLHRWGFPVGELGVELVFKPDATLSDEAFKRVALPALKRIGEVIAFFDNEPANCNVARQAYPNAIVGLIDTQSVPGSPAPDAHIDAFSDFRVA